MSDIIYPKLHDLLKLTGDSQKHFCPEGCDELKTIDPNLKKALKHHCVSWWWASSHKINNCNPFPLDRELLCIHLADVKAATISRKLRNCKYPSHKTFHIWKEQRKSDGLLKKEREELAQYPTILKEVSNTTNPIELYKKFEQDFRIRSEDARYDGCPFASLHTHNELTALWYSFFLKNSEYFKLPEEIEDRSKCQKIRRKFNEEKIAIVRLKLTTHGKLSRIRDTKIIKDYPKILEEVKAKTKGVIFYHLSEEILLITLPDEANGIEKIIENILGKKTNYYFEATVVPTILSNKEFLHKYNELFDQYQRNLYPALEAEIIAAKDGNEASHRAIVCDMCQMASATKIYPRELYPNKTEIEPVEEFLCEGCFEIRADKDNRAKKLATWEDEGDASVAFFKISLDMGSLVELLKKMFQKEFFLDTIPVNDDLGFSILKEFLSAYNKFVDTFRGKVLSYENYQDDSNHEIILPNLFCIKTTNGGEVKPLIFDYVDLFDGEFPEFVEFVKKENADLPIKLSVTISNVKYPFMEHWQILNNPQEAINIYAIPNTKLAINFKKFDLLRNKLEDKRVSTALHNLSYIGEKTNNIQFLIAAAKLEMKNDLKELFSLISNTESELTISDVLSYYKIMRKG